MTPSEKIRVLLVDDNAILRLGVKVAFDNNRHVKIIGECGDGCEVLDYLNENHDKIDVILMDISMPEMDGIEATKLVKKHYQDIKVVGFTMNTEDSFREKMISAGASDFVPKHCESGEVADVLRKVCKD